MTLFLFGVTVSLILSAFFSGSESGFYFVKKERLTLLQAQGHVGASRLLKLLKSPGPLVGTMLIGNNIAIQMGTEVTMRYLNDHGWSHPYLGLEVTTTLMLFLPFFIFGEVLPKATYRLHGEFLLIKTVYLVILCRWIFSPIGLVVGWVVWILRKYFRTEKERVLSFDRENMSENIGHAYAGGVISEEQLDSLSQAMNAGEMPVERGMTPLLQGTMISIHADPDTLRKIYEDCPQTVYAVYGDRRTDLLGVLDMRGLIKMGYDGGSLRPYLVQPPQVEWGQPFHVAVELFFEQAAPMVFVTRGGKVVGYITWVDSLMKLLK